MFTRQREQQFTWLIQIIKWDERNTKTKICTKESHNKIINCKIVLDKLQVRRSYTEIWLGKGSRGVKKKNRLSDTNK